MHSQLVLPGASVRISSDGSVEIYEAAFAISHP
jgi:hypothetical protein